MPGGRSLVELTCPHCGFVMTYKFTYPDDLLRVEYCYYCRRLMYPGILAALAGESPYTTIEL